MEKRVITKKNIMMYREYLVKEEKANLTIEKYVHDVGKLTEFLRGRKITKELLLEYREYLKMIYQPRTVNSKLCAINSYLVFTQLSIYKVKLLRIQRSNFVPEALELNENDYFNLLEAAIREGNHRLYLIIMTLAGTGIRISELPYITVESLETGLVNIQMKGKNRIIIISRLLVKRLALYAGEQGTKTGPIFCTKKGRPLDRSNISHEMKQLATKAGVSQDKVYPHNLRRLFARVFYRNQKDLSHLADILGHSSIETTRIYVATSTEEYEKILDQMGLIL